MQLLVHAMLDTSHVKCMDQHIEDPPRSTRHAPLKAVSNWNLMHRLHRPSTLKTCNPAKPALSIYTPNSAQVVQHRNCM